MRLSDLKREFSGWDNLPEDPEIFVYVPVNPESGLMDIREAVVFTKDWGKDKLAIGIFLDDIEDRDIRLEDSLNNLKNTELSALEDE